MKIWGRWHINRDQDGFWLQLRRSGNGMTYFEGGVRLWPLPRLGWVEGVK